jgi:YNFM family putative membrane transporter
MTGDCAATFEGGLIRSGTKSFRHVNLALFASGFVTFVSLYAVQPLLPVFAREFGVSPAHASLPLSIATGAMAICMLVAGTVSETWGRKPIMTVSLVLTSLLAILTAFSQTFTALVVVRLLQGIVLSGLPSVALAYLNEEIDQSSVGTAVGLYISGNAIGGVTGRILTAVLTDLFSWRVALATIGIICLGLTLVFIYTLPPPARLKKRPFEAGYLVTSLVQHLREPGLVSLFGLAFVAMGSFVTLYNYLTFRLIAPPYSLSQTNVSLVFVVYFIGSGITTTAGRLVNRFGRSAIIRFSLVVMLGGALLTLAKPLFWIIAGVALFTSGFFGAHAVASGWVGRRAKTALAQASSLYFFFYYLGSSVSGTIGGYFWIHGGWYGVAGLIGVLLAVALAITVRLSRLAAAE